MASWFVLIALWPALRAQTPPQQPASAPAAPEVPPVHTSITVTEQIVTEAPANITDVNAGELRETPGVNLDDRLRQVPGFSLFRRTSSLVAHPTTQGVSLRGLGSTGASRTLVLWDGVPMNDPFGGWVYWTRIPPEQIERAEVSRGASTSVFGDRAMAGAISILSHDPDKHLVTASYEGGNLNTHELTFGASDVWRHAAASAFVRAFSTDGYFIVPRQHSRRSGLRCRERALRSVWRRAPLFHETRHFGRGSRQRDGIAA
jgi:outer membrane receptor for ferrienterochelin and colicin